MSVRARGAALERMRVDLEKLDVVELVPVVVMGVHDLLARHPLRAADALQLAAALYLFGRVGRAMEFIVYDERLAAAARRENLRVRP